MRHELLVHNGDSLYLFTKQRSFVETSDIGVAGPELLAPMNDSRSSPGTCPSLLKLILHCPQIIRQQGTT